MRCSGVAKATRVPAGCLGGRCAGSGDGGWLRSATAAGILLGIFLVLRSAGAAEGPGGPGRTAPGGRSPGLSGTRLHALEAAPSGRLYGATSEGLVVSDDGGGTWRALAILGSHQETFAVAVDPADLGRLAVGRRDGLYLTRDGGQTWTRPVLPGAAVVPLAIGLARAQPDTLYVATARQGILRSADGGATWAVGRGLLAARASGRVEEFRSLGVHPGRPEVAYVAHERHGVFRTTDGGATWSADNHGLPFPLGRRAYPPRFALDPADHGRVVLVFGEPLHSRLVANRLAERTAEGEWVALEVDLPANLTVLRGAVDWASRVVELWTEGGRWRLPIGEKKRR